MYRWLVRTLVRRVAARSRAGDMQPTLALWAEDGHFVFPGRSSWAADVRSREEIAAWYERFARAGLQLEPHEIVVQGPLWNQTMCVHFTDHARGPGGPDALGPDGQDVAVDGDDDRGRVDARQLAAHLDPVAAADGVDRHPSRRLALGQHLLQELVPLIERVVPNQHRVSSSPPPTQRRRRGPGSAPVPGPRWASPRALLVAPGPQGTARAGPGPPRPCP